MVRNRHKICLIYSSSSSLFHQVKIHNGTLQQENNTWWGEQERAELMNYVPPKLLCCQLNYYCARQATYIETRTKTKVQYDTNETCANSTRTDGKALKKEFIYKDCNIQYN